ncbi:MAG: lysophospholipid acyltransferase family protein [Nitrosomonadales bacterium]|nr:lysophospholipid acyltransferase family protein [Nitrosomonadales bacterium]
MRSAPIRSVIATLVFDLAARFPLGLLHRLGAMLGWATYVISGTYARRMRENLGYAMGDRHERDIRKILNASIAEAGKGVAELPWLWRRPATEVAASIRACHGWEHVEAARAQGRGVIFLTPHLGCFEVSATYAAQRIPITVLYRPPKLAWLEPLMRGGRAHGQVSLARTDLGGVRLLFKAIKRGEAIGLLPDQVPGKGEGEWAGFFGRPAYTMTLVGRLVESTGAAVIMAYAERLPRGAGYVIYLAPLMFAPGLSAAGQINAALEKLVRACPAQYLWSYNRYKVPAGIEPPEQREAVRA